MHPVRHDQLAPGDEAHHFGRIGERIGHRYWPFCGKDP